MAVVLGTSSGFVTATPTADPNGTGVTIDGSKVVTKDTSPATAVKITEIGWYRASGTNAANWEIGLYSEAAGVADALLQVDATNSSTSGGWLSVAVSWTISPNTAYWLGLQMDAHTGSSTVDSEISGGAGIDVVTGATALTNPFGGGAVSDADGMYAIYALWAPAPTGAVAFPITFTPVEVGRVTARSAVAFPETFGALTNGVRIRFGQVVTPIVFGFTTAGDVAGGGADWFGAVVSPFTFGRLADGHRATLAHPTADSVDGNWTDQGGGSDLEGAIDDLTVSDSDYIRSELNPASSSCRVKLEGAADPNSSTGHVLRWRIAKDAAAGKQVDMEIRLYQGGGNVLGGGVEIATFSRTAVTETFTTYEEHLSAGQADAITNYADLYLEFEGVAT